MIQEANISGARLKQACNEVGISLRTYRRWYKQGQIAHDKRAEAVRPMPINKLTDNETATIIKVCNEPRFASLPPTQIVPTLLDEGIYHASESTFYRVLKAHNQLNHRGRSLAPKVSSKPQSFTATGPCQVFL